jgi:hypothetical protein
MPWASYNLPVTKGTVVVNGNGIAVNVAELLRRPPDMRWADRHKGLKLHQNYVFGWTGGRPCPSTSYLLHGPPSSGRGVSRPFCPSPHAVVAELVDALA